MSESENSGRFGIHEDWWFGIGMMLFMFVIVPLTLAWCFG